MRFVHSSGLRPLLGLALLLLEACTSPSGGSLGGTDPTPPDPVEATDPVVTEETIAFDADGDGDSFFPGDRFVQIEIELPSESWAALLAAPYEFTPADVVLDGRRIENVGVRLRGRIGSFRTVDAKPKWRIDFNRYEPGRRVDGLEALSLDNNVVDCSGLKQMLGFHVLALAGVPGSRAGFAQVSVNGAYYGVYNTIELQDDRFLRRTFLDGSGTLYDGAYVWYGEWDYTLLDFIAPTDMLYELEEGTDVGHADIRGVTETLAASAYQPGFVAAMDEVWDMDAFYRFVAAEFWIGQNDGYILNTNNNRVYFDPTDGRARLISYDLDYAFLPQPWEYSWTNPRGAIAHACFSDVECRAGVVAAIEDLLEVLAASGIEESLEAWDTATWTEAAGDPKMECGGTDVWNARNFLWSWVGNRDWQTRDAWGIP